MSPDASHKNVYTVYIYRYTFLCDASEVSHILYFAHTFAVLFVLMALTMQQIAENVPIYQVYQSANVERSLNTSVFLQPFWLVIKVLRKSTLNYWLRNRHC